MLARYSKLRHIIPSRNLPPPNVVKGVFGSHHSLYPTISSYMYRELPT